MKRPKSILPLLSPRLKSWVGVPSKGGYDKCSILPAPRGPGGAQNRATPTPNESNLAERSAGSDPSCVTSSLTLLIADHRGDGLEQRLETLGHGRYRVLVTHDLRATLRAIEKELPSVIVVETLSKRVPKNCAPSMRSARAIRRSPFFGYPAIKRAATSAWPSMPCKTRSGI